MAAQLETNHLETIRSARELIKPHIRQTPLIRSDWLSELSGNEVFLKAENLQVTRSFKARGALYKLLSFAKRGIQDPLLAVSAGNHGQGLAWASKITGHEATVIVPKTAPQAKIDAIRRRGANLRIEGDDYDQAEILARKEAEEKNITFVSPYNDIDIVHGQGTVGLDVLDELPSVDVVLVPVSGGGLLAGVGLAIKQSNPNIKVVGVQAENSCAMLQSFRAGKLITVVDEPTIADGLAGNVEPGSCTFPLIQSTVDDIVTVSESEIKSAILATLKNEGMLLEGAGAVGIAVLMSGKLAAEGKTVAVILTGGNIDFSKVSALIATDK
jgi:threonine dehydratase